MEVFFEQNLLLLIIIMLWVLPWKGYAMWSAAQLGHRWWFIALLILNTLAVLDIIYIFAVAKKGGDLLNLLRGKTRENNTSP